MTNMGCFRVVANQAVSFSSYRIRVDEIIQILNSWGPRYQVSRSIETFLRSFNGRVYYGIALLKTVMHC
jgi:hypothetical protein